MGSPDIPSCRELSNNLSLRRRLWILVDCIFSICCSEDVILFHPSPFGIHESARCFELQPHQLNLTNWSNQADVKLQDQNLPAKNQSGPYLRQVNRYGCLSEIEALVSPSD